MSSSTRSAALPVLNGRSDAKRDAILRGAKAVFLKHGFESTSMDVVALRAGVSKMTVYRHFGSKEALFAGVITNLCERIVDGDIREIFDLPPRDALMTFARKMIAIVFAHETVELHRIVIAESRRFPKLGRLFYQSGPEACVAALTIYFDRHVDDAQFKVRNPRRAAEEFLELLRGYAHLRVMLGLERVPSSAEMEERIEGAIRHVLN
jgi:TetR/AcrR family transcriptional regulator, mexJK operon transcriptional repressor